MIYFFSYLRSSFSDLYKLKPAKIEFHEKNEFNKNFKNSIERCIWRDSCSCPGVLFRQRLQRSRRRHDQMSGRHHFHVRPYLHGWYLYDGHRILRTNWTNRADRTYRSGPHIHPIITSCKNN